MAIIDRELRTSNLMRQAGWLAAVLAGCLAVFAARAETAAAPSYAQLVAQAESGDPDTDFTALRSAYALSEGYDGYGATVDETFAEMWKAAQAKDCAKAIAASEVVLKGDYTRAIVHYIRGDCFDQTGDSERSAREYVIGSGLARSLLGSGDGKSIKTAYVVVTMDEERFALSHLNLTEERQSLVNDGGHNYDLIEGTNEKTGEKSSAYFNVDALLGSLTRQLGGPE